MWSKAAPGAPEHWAAPARVQSSPLLNAEERRSGRAEAAAAAVPGGDARGKPMLEGLQVRRPGSEVFKLLL